MSSPHVPRYIDRDPASLLAEALPAPGALALLNRMSGADWPTRLAPLPALASALRTHGRPADLAALHRNPQLPEDIRTSLTLDLAELTDTALATGRPAPEGTEAALAICYLHSPSPLRRALAARPLAARLIEHLYDHPELPPLRPLLHSGDLRIAWRILTGRGQDTVDEEQARAALQLLDAGRHEEIGRHLDRPRPSRSHDVTPRRVVRRLLRAHLPGRERLGKGEPGALTQLRALAGRLDTTDGAAVMLRRSPKEPQRILDGAIHLVPAELPAARPLPATARRLLLQETTPEPTMARALLDNRTLPDLDEIGLYAQAALAVERHGIGGAELLDHLAPARLIPEVAAAIERNAKVFGGLHFNRGSAHAFRQDLRKRIAEVPPERLPELARALTGFRGTLPELLAELLAVRPARRPETDGPSPAAPPAPIGDTDLDTLRLLLAHGHPPAAVRTAVVLLPPDDALRLAVGDRTSGADLIDAVAAEHTDPQFQQRLLAALVIHPEPPERRAYCRRQPLLRLIERGVPGAAENALAEGADRPILEAATEALGERLDSTVTELLAGVRLLHPKTADHLLASGGLPRATARRLIPRVTKRHFVGVLAHLLREVEDDGGTEALRIAVRTRIRIGAAALAAGNHAERARLLRAQLDAASKSSRSSRRSRSAEPVHRIDLHTLLNTWEPGRLAHDCEVPWEEILELHRTGGRPSISADHELLGLADCPVEYFTAYYDSFGHAMRVAPPAHCNYTIAAAYLHREVGDGRWVEVLLREGRMTERQICAVPGALELLHGLRVRAEQVPDGPAAALHRRILADWAAAFGTGPASRERWAVAAHLLPNFTGSAAELPAVVLAVAENGRGARSAE